MSWKNIALPAVVVMVGCVPPGSSSASYNRMPPGIIVEDGDAKWAKDKIAGHYMGQGYSVLTATDYGITLRKPMSDDLLASMFYGSRWNGTPELRVHFDISPQSDGLHIKPSASIVTNPGTGFERVTQAHPNSQPVTEAQWYLDRVMCEPSAK